MAPETDPRTPRVVYVVGSTHTGSTLTARILNQHPQIFAAGELQYLDLFWGPTNRICSCGVHALKCPVWGEVFWRFSEAGLRRLDFARLSHERGLEWLKALSGRDSARGKTNFAASNGHLYRAIAAVTGASVVIDGSKTLWRLLPLWRSLPLPLDVLHLIRSPEGQVASRMKAGRHGFWKTALSSYLRVNWIAARRFGTPDRPDRRYRKVRYEDVVARPDEVIADLHRWLGLEADDPFEGEALAVHDVGGNIKSKRESESLRPDPARAAAAASFTGVRAATLRLARRLVYDG